MEALKQTVADKDREIAELSGELQTLQAQLQTVSEYPPKAEKEEEVYRLMVETSELRAKLVEAEGEKWERERRLVAACQNMELLQQLIAELREKKSAAPQVYCCGKSFCILSRNYLLANKHSLCNYARDEGKEIYWQL